MEKRTEPSIRVKKGKRRTLLRIWTKLQLNSHSKKRKTKSDRKSNAERGVKGGEEARSGDQRNLIKGKREPKTKKKGREGCRLHGGRQNTHRRSCMPTQ